MGEGVAALRNSSCSLGTKDPGVPFPIVFPSTETAGISSRIDDEVKTSSAL